MPIETPAPRPSRKKLMHHIAVTLMLLCIFGASAILMYSYKNISDYQGTIQGFRWERTIAIEECSDPEKDVWTVVDTVTASGEDREPRWPSPEISENQRITQQSEIYKIVVEDLDGHRMDHIIGYTQWMSVSIGDTIVTQRY